jgi:hypothetical protein
VPPQRYTNISELTPGMTEFRVGQLQANPTHETEQLHKKKGMCYTDHSSS